MKNRIQSIEYIRGLSMLGVIGIHTGAYSLSAPDVNIHLFALLEIVTRFSVPIFFFVSAFGLFLHHDLKGSFSYVSFMKRRCQTVLLPYILWSLLYMIHYTWTTSDVMIWQSPLVYHFFLFGLASCQLYFLVILMWFYLFMPLWRKLVVMILQSPRLFLPLLLIGQIAFNYYSCYLLKADFSSEIINLVLDYRVSYWVLHYIFIFLLGAICAVQYEQFLLWLKKHYIQINVFLFIALSGMLGFYYILLFELGYSPEAAVNTNHQLSPPGVLYTLAVTLFLMLMLENVQLPPALRKVFSLFGEHSYAVYLIHPLVMYYLANYLSDRAIIMNEPIVIAFYLGTVTISIAAAKLIRIITQPLPLLSLGLTGSITKSNIHSPR